MRLIFCRHAESEANALHLMANRDQPYGLTERGIGQARELADELAADGVRVLYASHLLRAQQTARIVADRLGVDIRTSTVLRDFDCGVCEGRGDDEAWAMHDELIRVWDEERDYGRRIPGGESYNDIHARFVPFVEGVVREHNGADSVVAVIMHGAVMSLFLPVVCDNLTRAFVRQRVTRNCIRVVTETRAGGLTCVSWDGVPPE